MKLKPIVPRSQAHRDVEEAIDPYLAENAEQAALGFIDSLQKAYAHIARHPATGAPCYGHALNIPGLRCWPLTRYPYLLFFMERDDHIDVWRVLHGKRDIPVWLANDTAPDNLLG